MSDDSLSHPISWQPHQPADRVLMTLKTRGPQSVAVIAKALDVTAEAVRQQMARLHADGLVDSESRSAGRGRPTQIWFLTAAGQRRFPDTHADMTVQMINAVRQVFGDDGVDKLIAVREAAMLATYQQALEGADGLPQRLESLARVRSAEGDVYKRQHPGRRGQGFRADGAGRQFAGLVRLFRAIAMEQRRVAGGDRHGGGVLRDVG